MSDREDAVARALDLLPDGDPAKSDPRMLRDPGLVEEARLARETATDVWLAVSPLRAAPPDALDGAMSAIGAPARTAGRSPRPMRWLAAGGWAAALALAVAWWTKETPAGSTKEIVAPSLNPVAEVAAIPSRPPAVVQGIPDRERRLRDEVSRLRDALDVERGHEDAFRPRVISLKSPMAGHRSPEEDRERLLVVLTNALRSALEVQSGAPDDPASIVIERGWLPPGFAVSEDEIIRHRNFPESSWEELGLMKSDEGDYYDPAAGLVWAADEEGHGFLGRRATAEDDLSVYRQPEPGGTVSIAASVPEPEGFVIADAASGKTQVVLEGLRAPQDGFGQWLVWTDLNGRVNEQGITNTGYGPSVIFIQDASTGLGKVQVVERPLVSSGAASTVSANSKVLLESGK